MSARRADRRGSVSRRRFLRGSMLLGGVGAAAVASHGTGAAAPTGGAPGPETLDVRDFGAVGDGETPATRALQAAIDAGSRRGGAVVRLPAGAWLSGTVHLRSHVTLDLAPGAVLLASPDDDDFAPHERLRFDTDSDVETTDFANALVAGADLEHVAVTGAGVIDMNRRKRFGPKPIALKRCRFVTIRAITIVRSPNYCVSLGGCDDVLVDGVTIREAFSDGIDADCSQRVRITNCDVESDDDALCLKASFMLGAPRATEDVVVTNCRLRSPSNCFKLGTESTGDFRQIVLSNCVMSGLPPRAHGATRAVEGGGVAIAMVDGGTVDGVMVSNVVMSGVVAPLFVRLGNRGRDQARPAPGRLRNVSITGVIALGASGTGSLTGLPGHPVEGLTLENVRIGAAGGTRRAGGLDVPEREGRYPKVTMFGTLPASGLYLRHARDVTLRNVQLTFDESDARPTLVADEVAGLRVAGLTGGSGSGPGPVVWLHDVRGGMLQGNLAPENVGVWVRVTGESTRNVALVGNVYSTPGPVELGSELPPEAVLQLANVGGASAAALSEVPPRRSEG